MGAGDIHLRQCRKAVDANQLEEVATDVLVERLPETPCIVLGVEWDGDVFNLIRPLGVLGGGCKAKGQGEAGEQVLEHHPMRHGSG